jgi:GntR family transcriptional regulator
VTPHAGKLVLPPLSAAGPGTLYQQIVDGLRREISGGRLKPGSPLPSFRALAEELLVSVITVKRAYEELEHEGLIYRRQGLGTFVSAAAADRNREAAIGRTEDLLRDALREAAGAGLSGKDVLRLLQAILHHERESTHVRQRG